MHDGEPWGSDGERQLAEPRQSLGAEHGAREGSHPAHRVPKGRWSGRLAREGFERFGAAQHFVAVAHHAGPSEGADLVDDLNGAGTSIGEVAGVEDKVGSGRAKVRQHGFEGGEVAVNVGEDGDAHG